MVVWLGLRPVLDPAVAGLAQLLVRAFEVPRVTRIVVADHRAEIHREDFRITSGRPAIPLAEVHFNTIVLLALFLALGDPLSGRRWERLLMAWITLYLTQVLNLIAHVKTVYALALGEWSRLHYGALARNLWAYLQYFTDLPGRFGFPFLLWLTFGWEDVAALVRTSPSGTPRRGQPRRRRR